jgi:hypothetical protein
MFPKSTIINKKIPKQNFYKNIELSSALKKKFVDQIESIVFAYKFSKETINIPKTDDVEEIFVFDITLKDTKFIGKIEDLLMIIDKSIPYPILYRFELKQDVVFKIAYKKRNLTDANRSVVDVYLTKTMCSDEMSIFEKELSSIFNALDLKILYDNIMKLFLHDKSWSVDEEKKYLDTLKEIDRLNDLMIKEKQADRQYVLHTKIKRLKEGIDNK